MRLPLFGLLDRLLAPTPDAHAVAWVGGCTYAHRGVHSSGVPENSLAAFSVAIDRGLGIECDVQRTGDGQAVIFHDWDLDRMTSETGPVARHAADELSAIELRGSDQTIPSLRQFLDLVGGRVPVLIEVKSRKSSRIAPLCLAVHRALEGYRGDHAVISFDPRVARWFRTHSPETLRGLSFTEENDRGLGGSLRRRLAFWHAKPDFLTYDIRDLPSRFVAAQRRRGFPVVTWTVTNGEMRQQAQASADAFIAEGAALA